MSSAFHQLCQRYSGTLTPTAPTAIRLWETFTFFRQCYIPNFKHLGVEVLKRRFLMFFLLLFISFLYTHTRTSCGEPLWTQSSSVEQTWQSTTRQCYIPTFKHLSQAVLKKNLYEYFLCMLMVVTQYPWDRATRPF